MIINFYLKGSSAGRYIEEGLVTYLTSRVTGFDLEKIKRITPPNEESGYYFTNAKVIEDKYGDNVKLVVSLIRKGKRELDPLKYFYPLFA